MIEKPDYKVIQSNNQFELREYESFNIAQIKKRQANDYNSGFSEIFNYISGSNQTGEKISMTAPVITQMDDDMISTAFVMPKSYSRESLPTPKNANVVIEEFKSGLFAVVQFSGMWTDAKFEKQKKILMEWIKENKWEIESQTLIARYNPPFTPAFLRRNEILFRVSIDQE